MWTFGRAPRGGEVDVINGRVYKGGELLPFYVPRPIMPQIDEADYSSFLSFLYAKPVPVSRVTLRPELLHPHQRIDKFRAESMPPSVRAKPIWISKDLYILDGNHRWLAHTMENAFVDCWMIQQPFAQAIDTMFEFPKTVCLLHHSETN